MDTRYLFTVGALITSITLKNQRWNNTRSSSFDIDVEHSSERFVGVTCQTVEAFVRSLNDHLISAIKMRDFFHTTQHKKQRRRTHAFKNAEVPYIS